MFGVCSEGSGKQSFYLIDEAESMGKGAHSVVSILHHYFNKFGHGETDAKVHFDNCTGQNKNNVVLWYDLWRVMTGLHKSIEYSMMIAGHPKFEPDWHFGVWKLHWRNSAAETLSEVAESVTRSSRNGHNIPQVVGNIQDPVMFYEWKPYLQQYFKTLKHITDYHYFYMDSQHPGSVTCRENAFSESYTFNLLKCKTKTPPEGELSQPSNIKGLEPARQWYLYEQIRQHCYSDLSKNITCLKPLVPKKKIDLTQQDQQNDKSNGGRKKALLN